MKLKSATGLTESGCFNKNKPPVIEVVKLAKKNTPAHMR